MSAQTFERCAERQNFVLFLNLLSSLMVVCAVCSLVGSGSIHGTITFAQEDPGGPCVIKGTIQGLTEGKHGFHIYEFGDITEGGSNTGGHFNPLNKNHGAPEDDDRHAGDLGNIEADNSGQAEVNITDYVVSIAGEHSVIGRILVVNEGEDDLGRGDHELSLTTGNSGAYLGFGVIGIAPSS